MTIWSKFYWNDWRADPGLRASSIAARGLWMECLCIAADSDPFGYVLINGRGPDFATLARIAGVSEAEAQSLMSELDQNGVFSRDRNGRIYSRRMVRDAKKAATARKNGLSGGNPSLSKDTGISPSVNPPDKTGVNTHESRASNQDKEPVGSLLTAQGESNGRSAPRRPKRKSGIPPDFEPDATGWRLAGENGCGRNDLAQFIDHHTGRGTFMLDWQAAWRTWCRNAAHFRAGPHGGGNRGGGKGIVAALRKLEDIRSN